MRGPELILLPGLDGTGKFLAAFTQQLAPAVTSRIMGYPPHDPLGYEELEALVRARLPLDRPYVLLAESFGGPIALRIAAARPPGLCGLILCGTFAANPFPRLAWARPLAFLVPVKSLPRWLRAPLLWGTARRRRAPPGRERAIAAVSAAVVRRRIQALLTVDVRPRLHHIDVPVLVLHATHDRLVSQGATRQLLAHLPRAEAAAIEGPHLLLQSRPAECAARVLAFMAGREVHNLGPSQLSPSPPR